MAVLTEKTTARVKKGVAYYEGESFSLSNVDKVKVLDFSGYAHKDSLTYSRNNNDLIVSYYGANVTIKDYFGANGTVASTVKIIRTYDNSTKKRYKDYNLVTSGFLNNINSGVENFGIKKGVITGTPFADTISAADFSNPTGKGKDIGVTIKTGLGNDNVTGSIYKDTFAITGSGKKTINIKATDGNDTITGINTKDSSVVLNLSNTVLDKAINAANNAIYERVGNDLKITASETIPSKIENLTGYIWYKEQVYDNTLEQYVWKYGVCESDNPTYNFYGYYPTSFSSKPLYSYQDGNETKYTEYQQKTKALDTTTLFTFEGEYDLKLQYLVTEDGYDAFVAERQQYYGSYYATNHTEVTLSEELTADENGVKHLYSFRDNYFTDGQKGSRIQFTTTPLTKWSDLYMKSDGYLTTYANLTSEELSTAVKLSDMEAAGIKGIYWINPGVYDNSRCYTYTDENNVPANAAINVSVDDFDTTYYWNDKYFYCGEVIDYDISNTYYTWNEANFSSNSAPRLVNQVSNNINYSPITDTPITEDYYTTISTIYSYVKDGSMAYSFDAQTANYVEGATASASSTTTIKDYFKNSTAAPD